MPAERSASLCYIYFLPNHMLLKAKHAKLLDGREDMYSTHRALWRPRVSSWG